MQRRPSVSEFVDFDQRDPGSACFAGDDRGVRAGRERDAHCGLGWVERDEVRRQVVGVRMLGPVVVRVDRSGPCKQGQRWILQHVGHAVSGRETVRLRG